ncbi:Wzz/FepE/Etk N-terminal domain-containing protein [Sphingomonas aerolata]|uniref:Wzz/FepE/Etk N-terminal domain-containing protein n=1 Tax=Sphingomonas aerolata TaxID=185951 RepID=UPI0035A5D158
MTTAIQVYGGGNAMPISPYTPQASEVAQDRIDARALVAMFRRRLGIFLLVFLSILIIGLVLTFRQTPSYTAVAQVSLNVKQSALTPAGVGERPDLDRAEPSANFVDTQVEIIRSEAFARRVASALALPADPRFTSLQEPHGIRTWITSWFTAPPKVARPTAAEAEAAAITYVQDGVTATRLNSTYALHISFSDTDPAMAARIVNEFARQYTEGSLAKKQVENRDLDRDDRPPRGGSARTLAGRRCGRTTLSHPAQPDEHAGPVAHRAGDLDVQPGRRRSPGRAGRGSGPPVDRAGAASFRLARR